LRSWGRSWRCCCCCRGLGAANTDVTALYNAEVSEEVEDVGKDRLKTMVKMPTRSSLIAWSSTSLVGVWWAVLGWLRPRAKNLFAISLAVVPSMLLEATVWGERVSFPSCHMME